MWAFFISIDDVTAKTIFFRRQAEKSLVFFTEKFAKTDFLQDHH